MQVHYNVQGRAKKNLAKFSDTCSVRADGRYQPKGPLAGRLDSFGQNLQAPGISASLSADL